MATRVITSLCVLFATLTLSGCLQTRSELNAVKEKKVIQTQVASLQKQTADVDVRFSEINQDLRTLDGRIEEVATRFERLEKTEQQKVAQIEMEVTAIQDKMKTLEEAVLNFDKKLTDMGEQIADVKKSKAASVASDKKASTQDELIKEADAHFNKKAWKLAVVSYQKYLESYPKGKKAGHATLKIAESLEGLGKSSDARLFYEEVVSNYAGTQIAKAAQTRLKALKK